MKNLLHKVEKLFGVYRWHPQIALRYLPVVSEIKREKIKNPRILEIGSGSLGIAPYLKQEVTGIDLNFSPPFFPLLKQVKGNALNLPFKNKSFDFVLMIDMLEHIEKKSRNRVVFEAIRVAKKEVIIAVPHGSYAAAHDKKLAKLYRKRNEKPFDFFDEHIRLGLPRKLEVEKHVRAGAQKHGRSYILQTKENLNLAVREFLMRGWMTKNPIIDFIFRKAFLIFVPVFRLCNFRPTYRKIYFVQLRK